MEIDLTRVDYNPFRDTTAYPVADKQVDALIASIAETGFWDNLLVRVDPEDSTRYQLAYGHHRLKAALACGITKADIPVRKLSDDGMLHIMIKENSTQAGGQSAAAILDSVKAMLKRLSYLMLSNEYESFVRILTKQFKSSGDFNKAKGRLLKGEGLGKSVLHSYDSSIPMNSINIAISQLKADGSLKAILEEATVIIEAEKTEAERLEAERIKEEQLEIEKERAAQIKYEREAAELKAKHEREKAESAERMAKIKAKKDKAAEEAEIIRQQRLDREVALEAERKTKRIEVKDKADAARHKAAQVAKELTEKLGVKAEAARTAAEAIPEQTVGDTVAKYFDNTDQLKSFREAVSNSIATEYISVEQHEPIAKSIRKLVDDSDSNYLDWVEECKSLPKEKRRAKPIQIRMTGSLIRSEIARIEAEATGANRREIPKATAKAKEQVRLFNHVKGATDSVSSFSSHMNGIRSVLKQYPELAESVSISQIRIAVQEARTQLDKFDATISGLDLSVNSNQGQLR